MMGNECRYMLSTVGFRVQGFIRHALGFAGRGGVHDFRCMVRLIELQNAVVYGFSAVWYRGSITQRLHVPI